MKSFSAKNIILKEETLELLANRAGESLEYLDLRGTQVTKSLVAVANNCPNLKHLLLDDPATMKLDWRIRQEAFPAEDEAKVRQAITELVSTVLPSKCANLTVKLE